MPISIVPNTVETMPDLILSFELQVMAGRLMDSDKWDLRGAEVLREASERIQKLHYYKVSQPKHICEHSGYECGGER